MFLPDRYIKGDCPKCGTKDQYGDACEVLRRDLRADRPEEPLLRRLRRRPVRKSSEHYFFKLSDPSASRS